MVTFILAIAVLVGLIGLGIEIGITSWNIHRASKHQRGESAAEHTTAQAVSERQDVAKWMEALKALDNYASKISWLLNFLYNRYDKFADLEAEIWEGLKGVTGDTSIGEADAKYKDLKKALELIRVIMRASERMENPMNSITSQLNQIAQIAEGFRDEEENEEKKPESDKPAEGEPEKASELETPEAPDGEILNGEVLAI